MSGSIPRAPRQGRRPGLVRVAGLVAVAATAAGLAPTLVGGRWFLGALAGAGVVVAVGALVDGRGERPRGASLLRSGPVGVLAQLAALLLLVTALHAERRALLGLLPGPAAVAHLAALATAARTAIVEQSAPAPASEPLRFLVTAGAGLLALAVDVVAVRARRPALAGLPLLGVHGCAAVLAPGGLAWPWFAAAAAGYAALLAAGAASRASAWGRSVRAGAPGRPHRSPVASLAGAAGPVGAVGVVVALAVVVPALVPGAGTGFLSRAAGSATGTGNAVDPLIDLRSNLRDRSPATVLRYRTGLTDPQPLRLVTIDRFDGQVWQPDRDPAGQRRLAGSLPAAPGLGASVSAHAETARFSVAALRQRWLPLPYPATSVDFTSGRGDWSVDPTTLDVAGSGSTTTAPGLGYRVRYLSVEPTSAQLQAAQAPPAAVVATDGRVPSDLPPSIAATAREVVGSASTEYARAVALQDWFRTDGGFTYSTRAPAPRSASALADFLRDKRGYCVHFASAMAVMARSLGIPARVAVGFLPGSQGSDGQWSVTLQDAHAWPELYFTGVGWVRFEPTPAERTGAAPDWTVETTTTVTPSAAPQAPLPSTAAPVPTPSQTGRRDQADQDARSSSAARPSGPSPWWPVGGVLAGLAVLLLPAAARAAARRRRSAATGPERAEAAWAELVEQLGDLGIAPPPSSTPRQLVGDLVGGPPPRPGSADALDRTGTPARPGGAGRGVVADPVVRAAAGRLALGVESARYAPPQAGRAGGPGTSASTGDAPDAFADVRTVVAAVAADQPRAARWRWRFVPASGVRRLGVTRRR